MKKFLSFFFAAILCVMMVAAVNAADIYVNDGGTGDGTTSEAPLGSMDDAIEAIAAEGGTVHIVDTYTCADQYVEPAHAGDIVITGGKYVFTNGSFNRWYLSGEGSTTFENITFEYGAGTTSLIVCQFNDLIIGENVTFPGTFTQGEGESAKEVTGKCYIIGGYQFASKVGDETFADLNSFMAAQEFATDLDSHVTVKSGDIWCVAGFSRQGDTVADEEGNKTVPHFSGTAYITVDGGHVSTVYGGNINNDATAANVDITINGGTVDTVRLSCTDDKISPITADATLTVNNGIVTSLIMNNVLGKTVVNMNGGSIGQSAYKMDASLNEQITDGTTTLNIADGVTVLPGLSMNFTTVNGTVSSPIIPVITDEVVETEKVVETTAPAIDDVATNEGGINPVVVVVIVVAVIAVVAVVVVVAKKKK
ncbi:MAG: hypothetical protein IJ002_00715 [Clostridia bacterium]|nr:hypothetical protein [Clostridia bacterium]